VGRIWVQEGGMINKRGQSRGGIKELNPRTYRLKERLHPKRKISRARRKQRGSLEEQRGETSPILSGRNQTQHQNKRKRRHDGVMGKVMIGTGKEGRIGTY